MLAPRWFQPRIVPLLRGGVNWLSYHRQFLLLTVFKRHQDDVRGIKRLWLEMIANKIPGPLDFTAPFAGSLSKTNIVIFKGDRDHFRSLFGWEQFLLGELRAIAREKWLRLVDNIGTVPIAINVRRAKDFPEAKQEDLTSPTDPVRTPLNWFIRSLEVIRSRVGYPARTFVVSDGSEHDLRNLLALENVFFVRPGCAIIDLLVLAKAKILIASGGSSFSAWAAFLGRMPVISLPVQSLSWFGLQKEWRPYVGEFDRSNPSESFIEQAKAILGPLRHV